MAGGGKTAEMAGDLEEAARRVFDALERSDVTAVRTLSGLPEWDPEPWIADTWQANLAELAGSERTVTSARVVSDAMVRLVVDGDRGRAYVSMRFDEADLVTGISVDADESDGRFWVVVGFQLPRTVLEHRQHDELREEQRGNLEAFYATLTRGRIGVGEGGSRPPRWRDPSSPTQLHLDVQVADLEAAERTVLDHGATKLEEFPGWRVYADPVGHPFCLYPGLAEPTDRVGVLVRVVIDCADPPVLARFWSAVLDLPRRVEESPDRIVIARDDDRLPMIAVQRVPDYQPPRWPDPDYPAQLHLDIGFDNRAEKERLALVLGGTLLPPQGGSCPVYADPAGHPFCLCYKGE